MLQSTNVKYSGNNIAQCAMLKGLCVPSRYVKTQTPSGIFDIETSCFTAEADYGWRWIRRMTSVDLAQYFGSLHDSRALGGIFPCKFTDMPLKLLACFLLISIASTSIICSADRPNILFVIVDDQSPFDLKVYNEDSILQTPTIDRLAAEGMVLDGAYHMGSFSGAVCTPSRHMVMTGRTGSAFRQLHWANAR
ncbi:MAG: sulfatase-like hydrolase/transferase, partial [Planctomycetota bacterium]